VIPTNLVISGSVLLALIMFFPFIMLAVVYQMTNNKMLCAVISKGKPLKFRMLKIIEGEFVQEGNDKWFLKEKYVKLVNYPIMFPKMLGFMTRVVPCELVMPGKAEPLDWSNPAVATMSSKELEAILDPHWLRGFVLGVVNEAGGKGDKQVKMFCMLAMALSGICMILLFVVMLHQNQQNAALIYMENLLKVTGK